jgi:O-antigen/teichoic acid export membrane protein
MIDDALTKSAWGSAYNIGVSIATILLGFIRAVLLMRLLNPDDYGVVSLALFFATFVTPFSVLGIDNALIQKKDPVNEDFSTHFSLRLGLSILLLAFGFLSAPLLRKVYADQVVVVDVLLALLVVNIIQASYSTPGIVIRREMRFGAIAVLNLFASMAMTFVAPLFAFLGAGLWSLVAEQAASQIVRWVGFWVVLRPWRPSLHFLKEKAKALLEFGSGVLSSNLLGIILDRFDDFWTGTFLGPTALGYYSRAYDMAQYPDRILATPITNVFFPTYAAIYEDKGKLSKAFFRSSSFLVRAGFLFAIILLACAPELTVILFGEKWLPIVPIFQLMLIYIFLNPLYANLSYLLMGVGKPGILARVRLLQVVIFVVTVILFTYAWGTKGVAIAANVMMLIGTTILFVLTRRFVSYSFSRMFKWPTIAAFVAGVGGTALTVIIPNLGTWGNLILVSITITAFYSLILYLTEREIIHSYTLQIIQPIRQRINRKKRMENR